VRELTFTEAGGQLARGEDRALRSTMLALGIDSGPNLVVPSIEALQQDLLAAESALRHGHQRSFAGRHSALAAYSPAILRLNTWPMASGELLIDAILIPPRGPVRGWQRQVSAELLHRLITTLQGQVSRMEPMDQGNGSPEGRALASLLLEEVLPVLERDRTTALLLSVDRKLQAIPFAALPLDRTLLGERYSLTITPSLGLTDLSPPKPGGGQAPRRMLLAGASRFRTGLVALPLVRQELQGIAAGEPADVLLDEQFSEAELNSRLRSTAYERIHLATHAEFTPDRAPPLGRIHTSTGELNLFRLRDGQNPPSGLDLVSLSACRTALGDEQSELGLLGMALKIGGRSGLGTLWTADDAGNAAFFIQFYRYLHEGLSKDLALQATRQDFQTGGIRVAGADLIGPDGRVLIHNLSRGEQARYTEGLSHPYYWAGVVLTGSPW